MTLAELAKSALSVEGRQDAPHGAMVSQYELVMHTGSVAEYLPVLRVRVDHDRRKVYLYG